MKKCVLALLLVSGCLSLNANEFIQVVTEDLNPLNYLENNQVKGSSTQIVRRVLKEAGLKADFQVYPWARSYAMAQNQENTLIYTINRTPEREQKFKWIGLLASNDQSAFLFKLKSNTDLQVSSLEEAKEYFVGTNLGDVNHELLKSEGFKNIQAVPLRSQSIKMLFRERVDLIVGSYPILKEECKKAGKSIESLEALIPFKTSSPYMAISNKTSDKLVEKLRTAYQRLVASGELPNFEAQLAIYE